MSRAKQFRSVNRPHIRRNKFDLSHEKRLSADMFLLTPILGDMCIPGDKWKIGNEIILRMNPLVAPIMHEINCYVHYFFVPFRILWNQWEDFITGGKDGNFVAELPRWADGSRVISSLWDYFGFNTLEGAQEVIKNPLVFLRRAYNMIYNYYYRDPNITDEVDLDWINPNTLDLHVRCWEKDYFTSLLPWQQRGDPPAMPIAGRSFADFTNATPNTSTGFPLFYSQLPNGQGIFADGSGSYPPQTEMLRKALNNNVVDLSTASTFDVSDLRIAFQIQRFLERNARGGYRYPEFLKMHYNAHPRDDRLQRPEYIGGSKTPIVISEVLQTSQTQETPQGNMSGHGLSADRTFVGTYHVQEHGCIVGLMSIMPRTMYSQGIDRVWLAETKYDFYFPEFANLSEQAIYTEELYNYGPEPIDKVVGYQGRYDEYRYKRNTIHGLFRTDFKHWHLGREFANAPTLNEDLVRPNEDERMAMKRILAVPSEPMFLITFGNKLHITRPLPFMAEPGFIDHN